MCCVSKLADPYRHPDATFPELKLNINRWVITMYSSHIYIAHGPGPVTQRKETQQMKNSGMSAAAGFHAAWRLQGPKWSFVFPGCWRQLTLTRQATGHPTVHLNWPLSIMVPGLSKQSPKMWLPALQSLQILS